MPPHQPSLTGRPRKGWIVTACVCLAFASPAQGQISDLLNRERVDPTIEDAQVLGRAEDQLLADSARISDPGERSRALERTARALLLTQRYDQALEALNLARDAALSIPDTTRRGPGLDDAFVLDNTTLRDARLDAASATALALSEQLVQRGITKQRSSFDNEPNVPDPLGDETRLAALDRGLKSVILADDLASRITSTNFRSTALSRVTQALGRKSQDVARYARENSANRDARIDSIDTPFRDRADLLLVVASASADKIPLPAWRDRTFVDLVARAAVSNQFRRGLEIARSMPHMPSRGEALVSLAKQQAFDGLNDDATATYQEALETIVRIPLVGPRLTVAAVLLDSLLSAGRFEDARAAITLIPNRDLRLAAFAAVARSMGERGLVESAYQWIDGEAPAEFRDRLRREVADGLAEFVEQRQIRQSSVNIQDVS